MAFSTRRRFDALLLRRAKATRAHTTHVDMHRRAPTCTGWAGNNERERERKWCCKLCLFVLQKIHKLANTLLAAYSSSYTDTRAVILTAVCGLVRHVSRVAIHVEMVSITSFFSSSSSSPSFSSFSSSLSSSSSSSPPSSPFFHICTSLLVSELNILSLLSREQSPKMMYNSVGSCAFIAGLSKA